MKRSTALSSLTTLFTTAGELLVVPATQAHALSQFTQVRNLPPQTSGGTIVHVQNLAAIDMTTGAAISTPSVDCNFVPQFWSPSPNGGVWEIQITPTAIWTGGMFRTINGISQWGIARFTL